MGKVFELKAIELKETLKKKYDWRLRNPNKSDSVKFCENNELDYLVVGKEVYVNQNDLYSLYRRK